MGPIENSHTPLSLVSIDIQGESIKTLARKKFEKKIKIKPFVKYVNLNHMMATRYTIGQELELEGFNKKVEEVTKGGQKNVLEKSDQRVVFKKDLKKLFETR